MEINEEWLLVTIQYLQKTVNLTNVETLQFVFSSNCVLPANFDADIHTLFEYAYNLRSLIINCNRSKKINSIIYNVICLKLPRSIKYLSADISNVEDAQKMLERAEHLLRITFQEIPTRSSFMNDIRERVSELGRDVQVEMDRPHIAYWWEREEPDEIHCYPVHLWFGNGVNKQ